MWQMDGGLIFPTSAPGVYALTFPVGPPLPGQNAAGTLPNLFAEQAALAGRCAVEASVSSYQTPSRSGDTFSTDAARYLPWSRRANG